MLVSACREPSRQGFMGEEWGFEESVHQKANYLCKKTDPKRENNKTDEKITLKCFFNDAICFSFLNMF